MALYDVVDGIYRKVAKKYDPVDGVYRKVKNAYDPVDGVYRQYFRGETLIGSLAVGSRVWVDVDGVSTEFYIVNQGIPKNSSQYDSSCDGTWLLMRSLYSSAEWDSRNNDYENSDIHAYLNGTFYNMLDSTTQSAIKQVKIPYRAGSGTSLATATGAKGLSTKVFLLSCYEVGWDHWDYDDLPHEGEMLEHFSSGTDDMANSRRIGYYRGEYAGRWWLRTPDTSANNRVHVVATNGDLGYTTSFQSEYVRPAFIVDSSTPIDQSTGKNVIA